MRLRIKELRKERGWTAAHLADLVGISRPYITHIENNTRTINTTRLEAFARAFGVDPTELLDTRGIPPEAQELIRLIPHLSDDNRASLENIARALIAAQHQQ